MKTKMILALATIALLMSSCATTNSTYGVGYAMITAVKEPVTAVSGEVKDPNNLKRGTSTCTNVFGVVAMGDCTIRKAARDAAITNIFSVEKEVTNVLGIYGKVKTVVYGE